jgi:hypothetical protein
VTLVIAQPFYAAKMQVFFAHSSSSDEKVSSVLAGKQNSNPAGAVRMDGCESKAFVRCVHRFDSINPDIKIT